MNRKKILIVGTGFFGSTIAHLAAEDGIRVEILEKRDHIGGNSYSFKDTLTNVIVHKYGSHIFHTSNKDIWNFIRQFTKFNDYQHKVISQTGKGYFNFPINLHTYSALLGKALTPEEMKLSLSSFRSESSSDSAKSFREKAVNMVGEELYTTFIEGYTIKQWGVSPEKLPPEIISRIPVYYDFEIRYFKDKYQGIPEDGYLPIFEKMLNHKNIEVKLSHDFFKTSEEPGKFDAFIYSGPIDRYFFYKEGELSWRTLDFEFEILNEVQDFQGTSVINYPESDVPYTRIHEFKHLHPESLEHTNGTVIAREYSRNAGIDDEPYYPVRFNADLIKLNKYKALISSLPHNWYFGGRLGSYRYLDMHMAIGAALTKYRRDIRPLLISS